MKRLLPIGFLLALCSLSVLAGGYFMNDTGETVYGLRVEFSEPVIITSFGDTLTSVEPQGESTTFTFSGGAVEPWGDHWIIWEPGSASIVSEEWLQSEGEARRTESATIELSSGGCVSWSEVEQIASTILISSTPELYEYLLLDSCVSRASDTPVTIPVYVSVPLLTPLDDEFEVCLAGGRCYPLSRVDPVSLHSIVEIPAIPTELHLTIRRNGEVVLDKSLGLANSFQAITVGIQLQGTPELCDSLPPDFVKGVATRDCWNRFFYGVPGEGSFHRRDFTESTLQRIRLDGATDVYVTSFFEFTRVLPMPELREVPAEEGCETLGEQDLLRIAEASKTENLRVHVMYNGMVADSLGTAARNHLRSDDKSDLWMRSLLDQYEGFIVEQAELAERCGVDAIVLDWQDATVSVTGHEALWSSRMGDIIGRVKAVFSGSIEYNLVRSWGDIQRFLDGEFRLADFAGLDAFQISQGINPNARSVDDSISSWYAVLSDFLEPLRQLRDLTGIPIQLQVNFQSTDGYLRDGWHDVAIGLLGSSVPDFYEQARGYEALFQWAIRAGFVDGIVFYKYDFDDPLGPNLCPQAISRMDLSGSIRNKPAEAVVKRWFGGLPGPTSIGQNAELPVAERDHLRIGDVADLQGDILLVDGFDSSFGRSTIGGTYSYDSAEKHSPGTDPSSFCHIDWMAWEDGGCHRVTFRQNSWVKYRLTGIPRFNATDHRGIGCVLWSDSDMYVDFEIGAIADDGTWTGWQFRGIPVTQTPRVYQLVFDGFSTGAVAATQEDFRQIVAFSIFPGSDQGVFYVDNWHFFVDTPD